MDEILQAKKQASIPFSSLADSFQTWLDQNGDVYMRLHKEGDPGQNILYQLADKIYGIVPWQTKTLPDGTQAITLNGSVFTCTPTQNTTWTVSDGYDGQIAIIKVNNTGGYQVTFSTGFTDIDAITDTGLTTKVIYYDGSTWRDHKVEAGEAIYPTGNPTRIGQVDLGLAYGLELDEGGIVVSGNYAYISTGIFMYFYIYDISDPTTPTLVGSLDCDNSDEDAELRRMVLQGNIIFAQLFSISSNSGGVISIDVSDPSSPTILHSFSITGIQPQTTDIAIQGRYVYLIGEDSYMHVIDITDPSAMVLDNSYSYRTSSYGKSIVINHNVAYIHNASSGNLSVTAVDISNPASPSTLSSLTVGTSGYITPSDIAVSGKYLYTFNPSENLVIIDISDPTSMSLDKTFSHNSTDNVILVHNGKLILPDDDQTYIDITDPLDPIVQYTGEDTDYLARVSAADIQGNYLYCLGGSSDWQDEYLVTIDLKGLDARASTISAGHIGTGSIRIINDMDIGRNMNIRGELFAEILNWSHLPALPKIYIQSTEPTISEGSTAFWKDTDDSKYYLLLNITGTQKKVELT